MGWGLTETATGNLLRFVNGSDRALEFGSGDSTAVLCRRFESVTSIEHDERYAHDGYHDNLKLLIRPVVQYSDEGYEQAMQARSLDGIAYTVPDEVTTRIHNGFYRLLHLDLRGTYDFILLDGPFGNGRSLAFPAIYERVAPGTILFIDDIQHYDFIGEAGRLFNMDCLIDCREDDHKGHAIFKIKGVKDG